MVKKKDSPSDPTRDASPTPLIPLHRPRDIIAVSGVAFLLPFILYLVTLAPGITFEDSGELITAARFLGVPHQPGYPLFTLIGRLFTLLPFGTVAWRMNLLSAFFSAGACAWVCLSTILLIEQTFASSRFFKENPAILIKTGLYGAGLGGAILFGTAREAWEQAIITEVYGLNSFLVGLFITGGLCLRRLSQPHTRQRIYLIMAYLSGLAFANHTTSLMLVPLLGIIILVEDPKTLINPRQVLNMTLLFILGSSVYLYLLYASQKNPPVDWGNPENIQNLLRTISRHQYHYGTRQTIQSFTSQFGYFCTEELMHQWLPAVLLFAAAGLAVLAVNNRKSFLTIAALLLFTMPVTTYMTNFDVSLPAARAENGALVSVFYIPAYMVTALLAALAVFWAALSAARLHRAAPALVCIILPLAALGTAVTITLPGVSMRHYTCAHDYCDNAAAIMPPHSLYMVNWDPFCFPLIYYQFVEKKRTDLVVLDQQLLRRSWYVVWFRQHYPELARKTERETALFLDAVTPFENRKPYDGNRLQQCYIGMINAIIDATLAGGNAVYFSYTPEQSILRSYHLESQFVAYKYTRGNIDTAITDAGLAMDGFTDSTAFRDRMADHVRTYYGNLYGMRGLHLEAGGDTVAAAVCWHKARRFFDRGSLQARFVEAKLESR